MFRMTIVFLLAAIPALADLSGRCPRRRWVFVLRQRGNTVTGTIVASRVNQRSRSSMAWFAAIRSSFCPARGSG